MRIFPKERNHVIDSYDVLGCKVHAVTAEKLTELVEDAVRACEPCVIANHNLHSVYLYHHDSKVRELFAMSKWTHIDGMGVVMLGKMLGVPLERSQRITYVDWLPHLMERAADRNWRVLYLGSKPGVAEEGARILRKNYPGLQIETVHGYFDFNGVESHGVLKEIRRFAPHILMVGMGMPRQEHWIIDHCGQVGNAVILPCGAAMDYIANELPTPPRWTGRVGLEWLYRLIAEPGRLWRRYLVEPWFLLLLTTSYRSRSRLKDNLW